MKPEQLIALGVRLFAVWLLVFTLRQMVTMIYSFDSPGLSNTELAFTGLLVFLLFLTVFLWRYPLFVAKGISTFTSDTATEHKWSVDDVYGAGFTMLGVWILYIAVSDAIYWTTYAVWVSSVDFEVEPFNANIVASILTTVFEFVLAFCLILGAKGLTGLVRKLRYGGLQ